MFRSIIFPVLLLWGAGLHAQIKNSCKFNFDPNRKSTGYLAVAATDLYTNEKGWGFDLNTVINTQNKPFYFSVKLPEGNYKVTLTLVGSPKAPLLTTVKAESRRLMLAGVPVKTGATVKKTFIVNVKSRNISQDEQVALKPRELTKLDWDDKLTLEFAGSAVLSTLEIEKVEDQVTVYLAGNSTVVNQEDEPWGSWGQMIPSFFKPGVSFANHAESGLTLGSFIGSRRLKKVLSVMKPGDYLFIEFGHNDQKEKGANSGAYKSYTERLKTFITETRQKGGIPVIVTSTSRRAFENGKTVNTLGDFPEAARKVAVAEKVALIDLNAMTAVLYDALGEERSKKAFVHYPANSYPGQDKALADNTHFNTYGAYEIARCVVEGIKTSKLGIVKFLADPKVRFDPAKPDAPENWHWPESPRSSIVKPDGN